MSKFALVAVLSMFALPAMAANGQTQPSDPVDQKQVCKKVGETGSLVKGKKVCRSAGEWRRLSEASRARTKEMQMSVPGQSN